MPWKCSHGGPPAHGLEVAETVKIAEPDTNTIVLHGQGVIYSFGDAPRSSIDGSGVACVKMVIFRPIRGEEIALVNSPSLSLLSNRDRLIDRSAFGSYMCDEIGDWLEIGFWETGERETSRRLDDLEARLAKLEMKKD
jgi:hypothetical protein